MIIFKKLRYKNFLSTGNAFTQIDIQSTPTTLVIGKNGGGKSTMIDALHYALYGVPFRNINKPLLINSINKKDLLVELEFDVGKHSYVIRRGAKPSVFEVYQDGSLINQSSDVKEYQNLLEQNILKMSQKTFSQIVVLGSKSFKPFMRLAAGERREIIEDILDIQIFSVMNVILKEKVSKYKALTTEAQSTKASLEKQIEIINRHLDGLKKNRQELIEQKQATRQQFVAKKSSVDDKRREIEEHISSLIESIDDQKTVEAKEKHYNNYLFKIQNKVDRLEDEIEFYNENDTCPKCKQGIEHSHKKSIVGDSQKALGECKEAINQLNEKIVQVTTRQKEIRRVSDQILELNRQLGMCKTQSKMIEENITSIDAEIDSLSKSVSSPVETVENELKEKKEALRLSEESLASLQSQKQIYEVAAVLLKDTGIKTKIIRQYLPVINKLINKYLSALDFFVNFELTDNFEEVIKSRHRDEFRYDSFSEGEKARIDIAILFAWRSVAKLRNSVSTNLLILDEVFDGSLDTIGNDELQNILSELAGESHIFVISHRLESSSEKYGRTLKFEKRKNFSEMSIA